ncbi:valine--tRNA ligase [bacterium]|nr:valine--tRNA ligase [bacterium]
MKGAYDPKEREDRWLLRWEDEVPLFDAQSQGDPFSLVIPPPNVTGVLHLGHALNNTLQDVLVRWARLRGKCVRWIPGTDHAGIATQMVLERALDAEGIDPKSLSSQELLEKAWAWKENHRDRIVGQLKRLGVTPYWPRERFTMDERCNRGVRKAFVALYDRGIIKEGKRLVNWDTRLETALSDIEVERVEKEGLLWTLSYQLVGGGEIRIATTRPETIFADVAIAVHPKDERFVSLLAQGASAKIPLIGKEIPLIADEGVDRAFGEGALKVTPAHDPLDFEIGLRHNLPMEDILTPDGKMVKDHRVPIEVQGLDVSMAREKVVAMLKEAGQCVDEKPHTSAVGISQRSGAVIEPRLSQQWFLNMERFRKEALDHLAKGKPTFLPPRWEKIYRDWWEVAGDWCISRQLWWGHQLPVWRCRGNDMERCLLGCKKPVVAEEPPDSCPCCGSRDMVQEEDVLDTWFSSALWPLVSFGWPEIDPRQSGEFPTTLLVTGYDILFFWVLKMALMGIALEGEVPFGEVILHGLICDMSGTKMSKSKGNVVDPLKVIGEDGADALRFALLFNYTHSEVIPFGEDQVVTGRRFLNKVWNATRLALPARPGLFESERIEDDWIASRFNEALEGVDEALQKREVRVAIRVVYRFFWDDLCDWYLEAIKRRLRGEGVVQASVNLRHVMGETLKILSPFCPFIAEEAWTLLECEGLVALSSWPQKIDTEGGAAFGRVRSSVMAYRESLRALGLTPESPPPLSLQGWERGKDLFAHLARVKPLEEVMGIEVETDLGRLVLGIEGKDAEQRLNVLGLEIKEARNRISRLEGQLANRGFIDNAPQDAVTKVKESLREVKRIESEAIEKSDWIREGIS